MAISNLQLIVRKTRQDLIKGKQNLLIIVIVFLFCMLSIGIGFTKYKDTFSKVKEYRTEVREHWEHRPDKHPHRMAHYGYLVFRIGHPLNIFDNGLDDYLGNVIFLEAHKQNTANLSEAGSSGILVRFGTFSSAFILQCIVPLIILFLGFGLIVQERENSTLKIMSVQGTSGRDILLGKILGLWQFSLFFLLPVFPVAFLAALISGTTTGADILTRVLILLPSYMMYYFFISTLTVVISAISKNTSGALISLIGFWLLFIIVLPKGIQFAAQNLYPTPSRIAFETQLEKDILKSGDSHNPDDPHFKNIKDSLLAHYKVKTTDQLPFNYSGFVMKEGEKISSQVYTRHLNELQDIYNRQQNLSDLSGFINPTMAIKNFSMISTGTDFFSYTQFQKQAEDYRYQMAQYLNNLQIEYISNTTPEKGGPPAVINKDNWKKFPDFNYQYTSVVESFKAQWISAAALIIWFTICIIAIEISGRKLKLI
ncbi:ABC transporter permease [Chryseobacterium sp. SIMBA_028]|uniref:ABC transporter permease n=1 Tax=Chryseobacterium sp. SIMBA_028 TaxID=3085771 RepID=UPI00397D37E3